MKNWGRALILTNILILLWSCASTGRKTEDPTISITTTVNRARELSDRGEYKTALALYSTAYRKCQDRELIEEYRADGERIREAADRVYDKRDFIRAGTIYHQLLLSGITADIPALLTFENAYLKQQINACVKSLTENGLMKYREEKLNEAIDIWKKILAFDPENRTVAKAVQTAIRQRRQLKNIK